MIRFLKLTTTLLIPTVIFLGIVRLLVTIPFLSFEYSKPDFPEDPFGFDRAQRLVFATTNFQFLTQSKPLASLAGQNQNGTPLYNARELNHMQIVQNVFQKVWRAWQIGLVLVVLGGVALAGRKESRPALTYALKVGGGITAGLSIVIGWTAIVVWQTWFAIFHQVFFAFGGRIFDYSNTLIRLFPEKFWYDTALTISSLSLIAGSLVFWVGTRLQKPDYCETGYEGNENHDFLKPV